LLNVAHVQKVAADTLVKLNVPTCVVNFELTKKAPLHTVYELAHFLNIKFDKNKVKRYLNEQYVKNHSTTKTHNVTIL